MAKEIKLSFHNYLLYSFISFDCFTYDFFSAITYTVNECYCQWNVAVTVCSTASSYDADKAHLPAKCYLTFGAENRYSYV